MEPKLHRGDLAVVRERSTYRVGDVVLYDSRELGSKVLHRIVRVERGRFVLKGDNNSFLDAERPTEEQIVGTLWVTAPAVGRATEWLRRAASQRTPGRARDTDRARRRPRHGRDASAPRPAPYAAAARGCRSARPVEVPGGAEAAR